jgi:glycine hydroxymethyltransferase
MHVIAAKAVAFHEALQPGFKTYQEQVIRNAKSLAQALMDQGFKLITNGTDNHLMLVDLSRSLDGGTSGKDAESWLDLAGITVNKNTVPNEKRSPFVTSGIRIGTPAMTTRGLKEAEMKQVAGWIKAVIESKGNEASLQTIRKQVLELCRSFPVYGDHHAV